MRVGVDELTGKAPGFPVLSRDGRRLAARHHALARGYSSDNRLTRFPVGGGKRGLDHVSLRDLPLTPVDSHQD